MIRIIKESIKTNSPTKISNRIWRIKYKTELNKLIKNIMNHIKSLRLVGLNI
jgi:hypothetical protein